MISRTIRSTSASFSSSNSSAVGPLPTVVTRYPSPSRLNLIPIARWRSSSTTKICFADVWLIGAILARSAREGKRAFLTPDSWPLRLIRLRKRTCAARHVFAHCDPKHVQEAQRHRHQQHAHGISRCQHHRDHANDQNRHPPLLHVKIERRHA